MNPELIAAVVSSVAVLLILLVAACVWFVAKKRFRQNMPNVLDWTSVNPDYMSTAADGMMQFYLSCFNRTFAKESIHIFANKYSYKFLAQEHGCGKFLDISRGFHIMDRPCRVKNYIYSCVLVYIKKNQKPSLQVY